MLVTYTNHRGEKRERSVVPDCLWYGVSPFHEGPQWFVRVWDNEKSAERDYALKDLEVPYKTVLLPEEVVLTGA